MLRMAHTIKEVSCNKIFGGLQKVFSHNRCKIYLKKLVYI